MLGSLAFQWMSWRWRRRRSRRKCSAAASLTTHYNCPVCPSVCPRGMTDFTSIYVVLLLLRLREDEGGRIAAAAAAAVITVISVRFNADWLVVNPFFPCCHRDQRGLSEGGGYLTKCRLCSRMRSSGHESVPPSHAKSAVARLLHIISNSIDKLPAAAAAADETRKGEG